MTSSAFAPANMAWRLCNAHCHTHDGDLAGAQGGDGHPRICRRGVRGSRHRGAWNHRVSRLPARELGRLAHSSGDAEQRWITGVRADAARGSDSVGKPRGEAGDWGCDVGLKTKSAPYQDVRKARLVATRPALLHLESADRSGRSVGSVRYSSSCAPSSTTRLGGISKNAVADGALREMIANSRLRHFASGAGPVGSKVSRPRKNVVLIKLNCIP